MQPGEERQAKRAASPWHRDLLAGLAAIAGVLAVSIRAAVVGSDLRLVFAISMAAFFLAGFARGSPAGRTWARGVVISSPGLLGAAALLMNDGLHRWPIPLMISIVSILFAVLGVQSRRDWRSRRMRSVACLAASILSIPLFVVLVVPALVTHSSLRSGTTATARFAIRVPSGEVVSSDALHGQVVVLASWATWCLPCKWELPEIERAYQHFHGDPRVTFFAVDRGSAEETPARAQRYLEQARISVPLAFEEANFEQALGVDALPMVVILDREGRTRLVHFGYDASEHLDDVVRRTVDQLLAEPSR